MAIKHKTFELDKPGWIAALVDAHKRKEKYIMNIFIHQNGRVTDKDNLYNRLKTDTNNTVGFKSIKTF